LLSACSQDTLFLAGKEQKQLSDYRGQWLLINYWASWCHPCIHEIPELNQLDEQPDIQVLGYNFDRLPEDQLHLEVKRIDMRYPSLIVSPAQMFKETDPSGIPATMLIDTRGDFRMWLMGPQTKASITAVIEEMQMSRR
jgi:thiol-disulfide isomerase/thioredoxin